jgi:hypothetical protein
MRYETNKPLVEDGAAPFPARFPANYPATFRWSQHREQSRPDYFSGRLAMAHFRAFRRFMPQSRRRYSDRELIYG